MTLKRKALLILGIVVAVYVAGYYTLSRLLMLDGFAKIEQTRSRRNMARCVNALNRQTESLDRLANDWASWDDTYRYVIDRDPSYESANLVPSTLENAKLHLILIADLSGRVVSRRMRDPDGGWPGRIPDFSHPTLDGKASALLCREQESHVAGIYMTDSGPMLLAARPILRSDDTGPVRGTLMMGQLLGAEAAKDLTDAVEMPVEIRTLSEVHGVSVQTLIRSEAVIRPADDDALRGFAVVNDLSGKPALVLVATMPRDITAQGKATLGASLYSLLAMAVVLGALIILLLRAWVIKPVACLTAQTAAIARGERGSARLAVTAGGEIGQLSRAFNALLDRRDAAETALRESESRFRNIVDTMSDWAWELDRDGVYTAASGKCYKILGYAPDELIGKAVTELMPEDEAGQMRVTFEACAKDKRSIRDLSNWYLRRDGRRVCLLTNAVPMLDDDQNLLGYRGVARDITERTQAENTLRRSEEKYRLLVENANEAIVVAQDGMLRFFNCRTEEITGCSAEELASRPFAELIHEDDRQTVLDHQARRLRGEPVEPIYAVRVVRKGGQIGWVEISGVPIDWEGRPATLNFVSDVTERKQAERAMRDSEERFRQIAESVGEGFFLSDASDHSAIYVSPAYEKIWGFPAEAVYASARAWLEAVHPEDRERVDACVEKHERGRIAFSQEYRILRPDGSISWVRDSVYPIKDESGRVYRVVGVTADVTESKLAKEALQQSEKRYRLLAENASDLIWAMDIDLNFTYVSPSVTRMMGYTAEEMMELNIDDFLTPRSIGNALEALQDELSKEQIEGSDPGRSRTLELEQIRKDGSTIWTESHIVFTRDAAGNPVGIQGVTRDIAQRRRAEDALRESEEKYRDLFENASDLIQSVGPDGRFRYVNCAWREILGYDEADVASLTLLDIIHPDSHEHCRDVFRRVMSGERVDDIQAVFVAKDGTEIAVEGSANCRFLEGKPVATRAIFRDVTEKKRAEQAMRGAAAREKRDREALEATLAAAWEVTAQRTEGEICRAAVEAVMNRLGFDRSGIWLASDDKQTVVGKCGTGRTPGTVHQSVVRHTVQPGSLVERILSGEVDTYVTEDYASSRQAVLDPGMEGVTWYAAVALKVPEGVIGYLCADNLFTDRPIDDTQLTRLSLFAQNVANAILNAREVMERTRAEKLLQTRAGELEILTHLLNSARDRMESVIESVGQGIISLDNGGQIHSVNREAARILAQDPGRLVGQVIRGLSLRFEELPELALADGDYPRTIIIRRGDIVVEASAFRIYSTGESPGVTVTLTDITERDKMQQEIEEANRLLAQLAVTDAMTGLANHRRFQEEIARQAKLANRTSRHLSLLMIDVDHFKDFNDEHGHPAGDKVLSLVGSALQQEIRESDLAARYGGEEFAVILVETGPDGALEVAERIRSAIEALSGEDFPATVTISIGTASLPSDGVKPSELIEAADKALYAAKQGGRNRVCSASSSGTKAVRRAG